MKIKIIPIVVVLLLCNTFLLTGQINTFSECYFTHNGSNIDSDREEILHETIIDNNGDYLVFGTQENESLFGINNSSSILHHARLNANGISTFNLQFAKNQGFQATAIMNVTHSQINSPICSEVNWLLVSERVNSKTDVFAYSLDNTNTSVTNAISLTNQTDGIDYTCNDFIQNNMQDVIWVGSEKTSSNENIILSTLQQNCQIGLHRRFEITDPLTNQPLDAKAYSIIELNKFALDMGAYAITGQAGKYAFCLLLDQAFNPVNGQIHLFKANPSSNYTNSAIKIKQIANNHLVILGNTRNTSTSFGYDEYFFTEFDHQTMNVLWSSKYHNNECSKAQDFEINSKGDYVVVGNDSYDCNGSVSGPFLKPGWAFMSEISQNKGTLNWSYRHHQNKSYLASPFGSLFNDVEILTSENAVDEIFTVGTCWQRKFDPISDGETESSSVKYQTNYNYFAVKTDTDGMLLDNSSCYEPIDVNIKTITPKIILTSPNLEDLDQSRNDTEWQEAGLEIESEFCDQTDYCCQDDIFDSILNQGGSYQVSGCQSIEVNLNAVGTCWQVTWDWGDGTTTGPIAATTDPITHNYSQNANGYYISWFIEEVDLNGNICNSGYMDFGVSIYVPSCECEECPGFGFTGPELITNGDFTNGYTGFSSDFGNSCSGYGLADVQNNVSVYNCNYHWCATGQSGTSPIELDNFLTGDAFRGQPIERDVLWEQTITGIDQNSIYTFCGLFRNLLISPNNPDRIDPVVDIEINGQLKVSNFAVPYSPCEITQPYACGWEDLNFLWNSGTDTYATIKIYLHQAECPTNGCAVFGADLAVDNLSFRACSSTESEGFSQDLEVEINNLESEAQTSFRNIDTDEFKIFPNPTNAVINVNFENSKDRVIHILNMTGKLMTKQKSSNTKNTIDLSGYNSGLYILMVEDSVTGVRSSKLITKVN